MSKHFEDESMKRIETKFPEATLKYLGINYSMIKLQPTTVRLRNCKQILDFVAQITEKLLLNIENHSTTLSLEPLGIYSNYKVSLRVTRRMHVMQCIICTADPDKSMKELDVNDDELINYNIHFTKKDNADEKIKILKKLIDNNQPINGKSVEVIYLTVGLYMKSDKSKAELLLEMVKITNQITGLKEDELDEIRLFQHEFYKKFKLYNHELGKEIENMLSVKDMEYLTDVFPEAVADIRNEGIRKSQKDIALRLKEDGDDYAKISRVTGLSIGEIEKL